MNVRRIVLKGFLCGMLFISAFYWSTALTFFMENKESFSVVIVCALVTNVLIGFLLAAGSYRSIFYEWLISLPAAFITFLIYEQLNFVYYWLNQAIPGYGNLSAGAGFSVLFYLFLFCLCFPAAIIVAAVLTKRNRRRRNLAK
ncbi:MAG TPA: hypothetical protein VHP54_07790 [Caproiciproducens sp.]|nr:hypothetical protein [Caproiciproducens sp.]